ncbi:unnamed protein product, partial [Mycena citricolor]
VHPRGNLLADQLADLVVNTRRDWFEEVRSELPSFKIGPGEAILMDQHEVVHQASLFWPQEPFGMQSINDVAAVLCVTASWSKWWGNGV